MISGTTCYRTLRKTLFLLASGSFALGVGSGCDAEVRSTVLSGFQGLATSLVNAVFINIAANAEDGTTTTTTTN